MMIPIHTILAANYLIWRKVYINWKDAVSQIPGPENPNFDPDMDALYNPVGWKTPIPLKIDLGTHAYLEELGWYEPEDTIWVEGYELFPGDPASMEIFMKLKDQIYLQDVFEGAPLEEGGKEKLYYKWFLMLGASPYGAAQMVEQKILPWEL